MADDTAVAPPPKKRRKRKRKDPQLPSPVSEAQNNQFRATLRAFVLYLQSPGTSVRAVWEQGRLKDDDETAPYIRDCITLVNILKIASKEKWAARRTEHWDEVKERVQSRLLDHAVRKELDEISVIEGLKLVAMDHMTGNEEKGISRAQPRSLEGMMKAYMDFDKLNTEKRGRVSKHVAEAAAAEGTAGGIVAPQDGVPAMLENDDGFTEEEVLVMSEALAESRALKMIEASQEEPEAAEEPVPDPFATDAEVDAEAERLAQEGRNDTSGNSAAEETST